MAAHLREIYCPVCGHFGPAMTGKRDAADGPFASSESGSTRETVCTFQCKCGVTFAHSVKHERAKRRA